MFSIKAFIDVTIIYLIQSQKPFIPRKPPHSAGLIQNMYYKNIFFIQTFVSQKYRLKPDGDPRFYLKKQLIYGVEKFKKSAEV